MATRKPERDEEKLRRHKLLLACQAKEFLPGWKPDEQETGR